MLALHTRGGTHVVTVPHTRVNEWGSVNKWGKEAHIQSQAFTAEGHIAEDESCKSPKKNNKFHKKY